MHQNVQETVIILDEGNLLHQKYDSFDMLIPWSSLNGRQPSTEMCYQGAVRNIQ